MLPPLFLESPWGGYGYCMEPHLYSLLIDVWVVKQNIENLFLKVTFCTETIQSVKDTRNIVVLLLLRQSLARSQADKSSHSADNAKKVFVLNASERIRKIEGNSYCADCSTPSKF